MDLVRSELDLDWYTKTYKEQIDAFKLDGEPPEYFYVRIGARMGHDPHPYFSEVFFRLKNDLVGQRLFHYPAEFGYLVYLMNRRTGGAGIFELADYHTASLLRRVITSLDDDYIRRAYDVDPKTFLSVADFYISENMSGHPVDPSPDFSEDYYLRQHVDVAAAQRRGELISGFQHYIAAGRSEERTVLSTKQNAAYKHAESQKDARIHLEENFPGITKPQEIGIADSLNRLMRPLEISVSDERPRQIHVFLMHFFPEIFFGGYGAFFDFLRHIKEKTGLPLRLYICGTDNWRVHSDNIQRVRRKAKSILDLFNEVVLFSSNQSSFVVSPNCEVWSYSAETHFLANQVAGKIGKVPYFFIQDDETMFHPHNSVSSFSHSAFLLDHYGIVNSGILLEYLKASDNFPTIDKDYQCCSFENKILPLSNSREGFLQLHVNKKRRRLIIYGRPESHAARNQFAFIVASLRIAIERGVFDDSWEFFGIGSLDFTGNVVLSDGLVLQQLVRISKEEYEEFIASGDIGISMISTPHPGIIHFQMAAFGLTTITNACFSRTPDVLTGISRNIVPVDLSFQSFLGGLEKAKKRAENLEERFENAQATRADFDNSSVDLAVDAVAKRINCATSD